MLGLVVLAAAVTAAAAAVLIVSNPAVQASIATKLPAGPVELAGRVRQGPILAILGTLDLTWSSFGPQEHHPIDGQSILLRMHLSPADCAQLAQIGGACGSADARPLRHLEGLRVEAAGRSLRAGVVRSGAPRLELEQHGETAHRGAPFEWTLRDYAPSPIIDLSCDNPLAIVVTAESTRPGSPLQSRSVTCLSGGVRYRLRIADDGPVVTSVGFNRVRHFQSAARADHGGITVEHGALSVDGDRRRIHQAAKVELDAEAGSTVSSEVVSPVGNAPTEVALRAPRASHALVDGSEETPDEFERIEEGPRWGVPIAIAAALLGAFLSLSFKLRPRRRNDAEEK